MAEPKTHEVYESIVSVMKCIRAVAHDAYAEIDVGSAQAKFLRHIGKNSRISQADLARATDTAPTLTGRGLEPLIKRGWVRRKRSEEDRREYILELTPAGQRARERVEKARGRVIAQIEAALDDRDTKDFDRIGKKILAAFGKSEP